MIKYPLHKKELKPSLKSNSIQWSSSLPFVENSRAPLIHRPRAITTHTLFKKPHISILNFCGNVHTGSDKFTFMSEPPEDSVLCERCEIAAVGAGLPSADSLAGRHVHKGGIRAYTTCGHVVSVDVEEPK